MNPTALVYYRLDLENEEQNDIFALHKQLILQLKNKIKEELVKKNAIKFNVSLHTRFHLGMDSMFITELPAVLTTDTEEIFSSSNLDETLYNTYCNLVKRIEDLQQCGSG